MPHSTGTGPAPAGPPVPAPTEPEAAAPASRGQYILCGTLQLVVLPGLCVDRRAGGRLGLRVDLRRLGSRRHLPSGGSVRRRRVRGGLHPAGPGQVGAHRPVETAADPDLEPGLRAVLGRQDAGPVEPAGLPGRRLPAAPAVPARAGREGRAGSRDLLCPRARVHRPAHHRRGHGDPQGRVLPVLPGAGGLDRDRRGDDRQGRVHRREDRARHQFRRGRRGADRARLRAASAARPSPAASGGTGPRPSLPR